MNNKDYDFRNETGTWQTGRTQPPKRYGGLIALLLVLVILLSGISTALSIMNIKLQRKLSNQTSSPMSFSRSADAVQPTEAVHEEVRELQIHLGISGTFIPPVYQRYYKLPGGIYVSRIAEKSEAQEKGLVVGDIITAINGWPVNEQLLSEFLTQEISPDEPVELTLYRSGSAISITLTWSNFE